MVEVPFGAGMRKECFMLEDTVTFLNHGAFGSPLKVAFDAAQLWRVYVERNPLRFIDRHAQL